ncbi:hypothetical protein [Paraburkholderia aromaticivorans]
MRRIGRPVRVLWPFPSQLPTDVNAIYRERDRDVDDRWA